MKSPVQGSAVSSALVLMLLVSTTASAQPSEDEMFDTLSRTAHLAALGHRYSLDEIITNHRIRKTAPRIEIDSLRFASGSASIPVSEYWKFESLANVINQFLHELPSEHFLLEGHTDAVGNEYANLELSHSRAVSVTSILIQEFGVPEFAIIPVGYGSSSMLIRTTEAEPRNRRVTLRRITDLIHSSELSVQNSIPLESDNTNILADRIPSNEYYEPNNIPLPRIKPKLESKILENQVPTIDL